MLIEREYYRTRNDGVKLYKSYSDAGFYILQNETQRKYDAAIDVETAPYTYTETDEPIEVPEEEPVESEEVGE